MSSYKNITLRGVYTALVTPFDAKQQINEEALRRLIRFQLAEGIDGLVILGTTGEVPTLSRDEQDRIITITVEEVKGQLPIIVGTGAYSTQTTVANTLRAQELGADIALIVPPYYNKPTSEGLFLHFKQIVQETKLPIIVYNVPGRTAKNVDTPTLKRIAELPNIIGVKETSGSVDQMMEVIEAIAMHTPGFNIVSGDDALTLPLISLGGHGVISVVSNLLPSSIKKMVSAAIEGDFLTARALHYQLLPLFKAAFIETNPIPIKEMMNLCGFHVGGYRLPLCPISLENQEKLKNVLQSMNLLVREEASLG